MGGEGQRVRKVEQHKPSPRAAGLRYVVTFTSDLSAIDSQCNGYTSFIELHRRNKKNYYVSMIMSVSLSPFLNFQHSSSLKLYLGSS